MDEQTPMGGTPYDDLEPPSDETFAEDEGVEEFQETPDLEATPSTGITPIGGMRAVDEPADLDFTPESGMLPANEPTGENPNRGRARERIARRKHGRGSSASYPSPVRNAPPRERTVRDPASIVTRGLSSARSAARTAARGTSRRAETAVPEVSFKLPINRATLLIGGGAALVALVVILLGVWRNRPVEAMPNALWIGTEWTYEERTPQEIFALTERLKRHKIGVVYAWVSWLQVDLSWRGEQNFPNVQNFVTLFREQYPEAMLYAWISLPNDTAGVAYRIDDPLVQDAVAAFSQRAVDEFGFDGVMLNIEQVWNNDQNYLATLRSVRQAIGTDAELAVAVPPDWSPIGAGIPVPPLIVPGTVWEGDYKRSVALIVDQIMVMAYNSGLSVPSDYTIWTAYQVQTFAEAIAELGTGAIGTEIVIGIPTYGAELPGHDPVVENVITAVEGIKLAVERSDDAADFVRGIALYAGWETDDQEWTDFMNSWVRAQ